MRFGKLPSFLSNWTPCAFSIHVIRNACDEQFMMAEKARISDDHVACAKLMATSDPREHKSFGRKVRGFDHAFWELRCEDVVFLPLCAKFAQNADAHELFLATGDRQIPEASPLDGLWEIGVGTFDPHVTLPSKWPGQNFLGKTLVAKRTLMRVRLVEPDKPLRPAHLGLPAPACPTIQEIAPPGDDFPADDSSSEDARSPLDVPTNVPAGRLKQVLHISSAAIWEAAASPPHLGKPLLEEHGPDLEHRFAAIESRVKMAAARREEEARQAAEKAAEEARIVELVNERVAARMEQMMKEKLAKKMAEMEVRQRAEQLSTED
ncbi:unnamed protein product [Ectocarpus sp. CCAP 1310/34]|nr:unnamed protein product [Ectocarpus sp. CCAP 1310/34]